MPEFLVLANSPTEELRRTVLQALSHTTRSALAAQRRRPVVPRPAEYDRRGGTRGGHAYAGHRGRRRAAQGQSGVPPDHSLGAGAARPRPSRMAGPAGGAAQRLRRAHRAGVGAGPADVRRRRGLYPGSSWSGSSLQIALPRHAELTLTGQGLRLMPSTVWRGEPLVGDDGRGRPLLLYPAVTALPQAAAEGADEPLAALLGRTRAAVLRELDVPRTTGWLAQDLQISPASASQHTTTLRSAGLVSRTTSPTTHGRPEAPGAPARQHAAATARSYR